MKSTARATLLLAFCLSSAGCGDGQAASTPGTGTPDAGTLAFDGGQDGTSSEAASETGSKPDAACSDTSELDAPDLQGEDSNCDGADGTVGVDVYLDPTTGDDSNLGSPDHPLKTLERAIALASSRQGAVLVTAGVFAADALSLDSNTSIVGGYDATFLGARQRRRTVFETGAEGWTIQSSGKVELRSLTVHGASARGATATDHAASAYALVLDVQQALLDDVALEAGDAVSGKTGKDGWDGGKGIDAKEKVGLGAVLLECFSSPMQRYTEGAHANTPNAYGQPAGSVALATPAPTGKAGFVGTDGTNASGKPSLDGDALFFGAASAGQSDGTPGYGGPGGAGELDYHLDPCVNDGVSSYQTRNGGGGGTGGCPGWGGFPGTSGGGAVALLIRRGTVVVRTSRLATGFAGMGGDGGLGGKGGEGGRGASPYVVRYPNTSCAHPGEDFLMPSQCPPDPMKLNCAAYGAAGGKGGDGGHGGGGAGGWTIGVLTIGKATAEVDSATQRDLGKPGTGGMGGIARAPAGQKAPSYHIEL